MAGQSKGALEGGGSRRQRRSPASVRKEEEEAGWAEWAERPNRPMGLLGRLGQKLKKNPFGIKIRFLNLQRLWKFVQGDLGDILIWGFFPKFI
jgi:hypothetical protein